MKIGFTFETDPAETTAAVEAISTVAKAQIETEAAVSRAFGGGFLTLVDRVATFFAPMVAAAAAATPVRELKRLLTDIQTDDELIGVEVVEPNGSTFRASRHQTSEQRKQEREELLEEAAKRSREAIDQSMRAAQELFQSPIVERRVALEDLPDDVREFFEQQRRPKAARRSNGD